MKPVITKEEVGKAIAHLASQGKKPTLSALHAAMGNRGSMSTLVRMKAELDKASHRPTDSPEALEAFRRLWALARDDGRREQEQLIGELRDNIRALATENESLEGAAVAAQKRISETEAAKSKAEAEHAQVRSDTEREINRAMSTMRDAGLQATKALQELADARASHAMQLAAAHAQMAAAQSNAHEFELQLVRTRVLLEAKDFATQESTETPSQLSK